MKKQIQILAEIRKGGTIWGKNSWNDRFASMLTVAASEATFAEQVTRLSTLLGAPLHQLTPEQLAGLSDDRIVKAVRHNPQLIAAWACAVANDPSALEVVPDDLFEQLTTAPMPTFRLPMTPHIPLKATVISPLSHGADVKAGNVTMFRRLHGYLPYISGNAVRGILRDLLANDWCERMGISGNPADPQLSPMFFYALFSGGALTDDKETKRLEKTTGGGTVIKTDFAKSLRFLVPMLSLLGTAYGNRVFSGKVDVNFLLPECAEIGVEGAPSFYDLIGWEFLTRREKLEARAAGEHHGMITQTEVVKPGTEFRGGFNIHLNVANKEERGCLAHGINLLIERGYLGAQNARGLGQVKFEVENLPNPQPYLDHIEKRKAETMEFLKAIGALPEKKVVSSKSVGGNRKTVLLFGGFEGA